MFFSFLISFCLYGITIISASSNPLPTQVVQNKTDYQPLQLTNCSIIPKISANIGITPIVELTVDYVEDLVCDANSKLERITVNDRSNDSITCNGVIQYKYENDSYYRGVFRNGESVELNTYNVTILSSRNNGNEDSQDCQTIGGGRCDGDIIWGISIMQADDQLGCSRNGFTTGTALYREVRVIGKCQSRCLLGTSTERLIRPINNWGFVNEKVV